MAGTPLEGRDHRGEMAVGRMLGDIAASYSADDILGLLGGIIVSVLAEHAVRQGREEGAVPTAEEMEGQLREQVELLAEITLTALEKAAPVAATMHARADEIRRRRRAHSDDPNHGISPADHRAWIDDAFDAIGRMTAEGQSHGG